MNDNDNRATPSGDEEEVGDELKRFPVVGIGTSAGGVQALQMFFENLPDDVGAAFVVVVHLDPGRQSGFSNILAARTKMPVTQVTGLTPMEPRHVYVIPPNRQLRATDHHLAITRLEPLPPRTPAQFRAPMEAGIHREAPETLAPPSIIVDESYRVVHLSEHAGRYLQPAGEKERRRHDASAGWKQGRRKRAAAHRRRLALSVRSQDNFCDRTGRRPLHDRASTVRTSD
jgi:CheB methylesterase